MSEAFELLQARESGLDSTVAKARLEQYGKNRLPVRPKPGFVSIFLHQFRSPLIYILAMAAIVCLLIDEKTDAAFIGVVLLLNAAIGSWQEWKAERGMEALQRLLHVRAIVVRDGEAREVDADEVVLGDVVLIESGNRLPADLRLVNTTGLEIDESLLTGESFPATKNALWSGPAPTPLGDRQNMAYAGSTVARGRAAGVVVATGSATAIGRVAEDVFSAGEGRPPLVIRMERFTKTVALAVLVLAVAIGGLGIILQGTSLSDTFLFIVALAVSAIPEGLPVAMTVALAVATHRMARRAVIVRRLAAVEGLGSCTLIATDKTGTLTVNELTVRRIILPEGSHLEVTGEGFAPEGKILRDGQPVEAGALPALMALLRAGVLCNEGDLHFRSDGWSWRGDPTDVALLCVAAKAGLSVLQMAERHARVNQIPFEPEQRYAASYHLVDGEVRAFVKGAPEVVLAMCADASQSMAEAAEALAMEGFRILAFAEGAAPGVSSSGHPAPPFGLDFLGFMGMIDPLRPGVVEAVRECRRAGIRVAMITGDHPVTALSIARSLGMADDPEDVATGAMLASETDPTFAEQVRTIRVFARVAPHEKLRIVRAARAAGHFVAVTGDGVNDAPALKQANIGVAMGRSGTDVAREAAELVLTDDNFASIVGGIEEGRIAYDNIRKVIYLLISTGAAELLLATFSVIFGTPIPLLPVQLLWLNLVTNGIQDVALAFEPGERGVMSRAPRPPRERIFNRLMLERTAVAAVVMASVGFGAFHWLLANGWQEDSARNALLLLMVLFENVHIGNCRSETRSAFVLSPLQSPILLAGAILAFLVHVAAMHVPLFQHVLRTEPVSLQTWATLGGLALSVLVAIEVHKALWRASKA